MADRAENNKVPTRNATNSDQEPQRSRGPDDRPTPPPRDEMNRKASPDRVSRPIIACSRRESHHSRARELYRSNATAQLDFPHPRNGRSPLWRDARQAPMISALGRRPREQGHRSRLCGQAILRRRVRHPGAKSSSNYPRSSLSVIVFLFLAERATDLVAQRLDEKGHYGSGTGLDE